jgi:hypothetical protein
VATCADLVSQAGGVWSFQVNATAVDQCAAYVLLDPGEYGVISTYGGELTPDNVLYVFTWGMGAVLAMWALGYSVGIATGLIRRA